MTRTQPSQACAAHTTAPALAARQLTLGYRGRTIVHSVDLDVRAGEVTAIVGANGCGKSTLLRGLGGLLAPTSGEVLLGGDALRTLPAKRVAQRLALLPQSPIAPAGLTVADLAARGRTPHQRWYRQWSEADERTVASALAATNTLHLAEQPLHELSGGQRQRAWISLVLAQETDVVLLDEPTTHLDLAHSVEVLRLVRALAHDRGRAVVAVLHDLQLAARTCDRLVVMREGRVVASGSPADVLSATLLADAFDLRARVSVDAIDGLPLITPLL